MQGIKIPKIEFSKLNPLSRIAKITNRELVGIDFCGNSLKLARVIVYPNRREVADIAYRDISGLSDDDISRVIRNAFNGLNAKNPEVINIISSSLVITKNIEIPSVDSNEIREIVNLQAGRHTPYSREEIIVDYVGIGTYKNSYTRILLVIVARNVIKRQFAILDKAGIKVENAYFAPEGIAAAFPKLMKLDDQNTPVNIIHLDEISTDFMIVLKDKAIFIRSIPIGAQQLLEDAERYRPKFAEEIKRSLEAYQQEEIEKNPATVVLTGAVEEIGGLETMLSEAMNIPAKTIPQFRNLAVADRGITAVSVAKRSSFLNVIIPLMFPSALNLNLIPEELRLRKSVEERGKELIKTGVFVLTIFVLLSSILVSKIYFKSAFLKGLKLKYKAQNEEAQKLENDFSRVIQVSDYLVNRGYSLEVLTELYSLAPEDLELSAIKYDEQGKLSLSGTAVSMSVVFAFVDKMEKSKYLKDVKTKYTAKRKEGKRDVVDFEISGALEGEG